MCYLCVCGCHCQQQAVLVVTLAWRSRTCMNGAERDQRAISHWDDLCVCPERRVWKLSSVRAQHQMLGKKAEYLFVLCVYVGQKSFHFYLGILIFSKGWWCYKNRQQKTYKKKVLHAGVCWTSSKTGGYLEIFDLKGYIQWKLLKLLEVNGVENLLEP